MTEPTRKPPGRVKPELRRAARSFVAGMVVLAAVAVLLAVTIKSPTGLPFQATTLVRAEFTNVHSLLANADVRRNSKRIGRVAALSVRGDRALVTMELDGRQEVYGDARAAIWDTSALASKFVELDLGTPAGGPLGERPIPASQTSASADLHQLLDVFDPVTRAAASSALRQVGGGAAGHGDDLQAFLGTAPQLLGNAGTVSTAVASAEFDLPRLIASADTLAGRFGGRELQISDLVAQADATLRAISVDNGAPLGQTLAKAPGTLRAVTSALDSLNEPLRNTEAAMARLEPGASALGESTPDLRGFLRGSPDVLDKVPAVAEDAEPATRDLTEIMSDARPVAPRVRDGLDDLAPPLRVLAPYAEEIGQLFVRGHSFVSQGPEPAKRYAKLNVTPDVDGVTTGRNSYPKPGEATRDRFRGVLGLLGGGRR